jgi:hypothetical protein
LTTKLDAQLLQRPLPKQTCGAQRPATKKLPAKLDSYWLNEQKQLESNPWFLTAAETSTTAV